jgi:hypothetical protein
VRRWLRRTAGAAAAALLGRASEGTPACPTNTPCLLQLAGPEAVVFASGEDGDTLIAVCRAPMAQPARES